MVFAKLLETRNRDTMKTMALSIAALGLFGAAAPAQPLFTTDATVIVPVEVPAQRQSLLGMPGHAAPAAEATLTAVAGDTLTLTVLSRDPRWEADQFVASKEQPAAHYALLMTGIGEGRAYTVTANGSDTLTLDPAGDDLEATLTAGDRLRVIPYWTPATLLRGAEAVSGTANATYTPVRRGGTGPDELWLYFASSRLSPYPDLQLYYYDGSDFGGPGWRAAGYDPTEIFDHYPIATDAAFYYRNQGASTDPLYLCASIQMAQFSTVLSKELGRYWEDNYVALTIAEGVTLAESALQEHPLFRPATSVRGTGGSMLIIPENTDRGSVANLYFYYDGASFGGPGWRKRGTPPTVILDDAEVFVPGQGCIVRFSGPDEGGAEYWTVLPDYLD